MKPLSKKQKRNWLITLMLALSAIAAMLYWNTKKKNPIHSKSIKR